ncbi:protein-tyrosine-phosphatase [Paenibacillus montaniterrae]|uniref:Protein-tyrosine-phosphatase n=1 Tax=Paenibacillus montaniterrae TaxID=429341 RepID=A0A919YSR6_9BACL|nr:low molecular weight protein arginine phosphatase [Paenibacillus montaniterrae]GIP19035.1 protein-tyrosine-phosphatase [Paenibacillus montaniterrae]
MKRILFLCTGNTCRSPMAEAFLKGLAHEKGLILAVRSAGISTVDGLPVSTNSKHALERRGIQHQGSSVAMNEEALHWADLILTMTTSHKREVMRRYPEVMDKLYTLKEYAYMDDQLQAKLNELEELYSELQMQQLLGQPIDEEKRKRAQKLELSMPSFDIADPFGGSQSIYDACADELEDAIFKLVDKLLAIRSSESS